MIRKINLKDNLFPILLTAIAVVLCVNNYTPGTWLTGWDNLHPEFNLLLNLKRIIFGVWRQDQGLGTVAAHAHMADLPRQLLLLPLSLIFPARMLRYLFIFATLVLGPLGVYFFTQKSLLKDGESAKSKTAAFLGALFYLLNLGTLQHFVVPFEMFNVQYAALGWLFLFASRYLKDQKRKDLILFSLVTFLATPMAYAPMLFYAYLLVFSCYLVVAPLLQARPWNFKPALRLLGLILIINSFWILPNAYFVFTHASDVPKAKINRLFSEEAFLNNKEYGAAKDAALLKGFLFNWAELKANGKIDYLLDSWHSHLKNSYVLGIGYAAFFLVLGGIVISIVSKDRRKYLPLLPVFLIPFIILVGINSPLESLFNNLVKTVPLLGEALRLPFTKFSILLMFSYAAYISLFFGFLFSFLPNAIEIAFTIVGLISRPSRDKTAKLVLFLLAAIFSTSLITFMKPAFSGGLISPNMRIKIPNRYFEMFRWLDEQEMGRIANFPMPNHWGWLYYDWRYQGSGFIGYGIKQPVLDRDFDRWSPYNEQYYREMSHAVYAKDIALFEALLEKYQINFLLLDKSVILPEKEADPKSLFYEELEGIFSRSSKVSLAKSFGKELKVYRTNLSYWAENFIYSPEKQLTAVEPAEFHADTDQAFLEQGHYFSPSGGEISEVYYPFRNWEVFGEGLPAEALKLQNKSVIVTVPIAESGNLDFSPLKEMEVPAKAFVQSSGGNLTVTLEPLFPLVSGREMVNFPPHQETIAVPKNYGKLTVVVNGKPFPLAFSSLNQKFYLGETSLNLFQENVINVYPDPEPETPPANLDKVILNPELCGPRERNQFSGVSRIGNSDGIGLDSRNARACVTLPLISLVDNVNLSEEIPGKVLVRVSFNYEAGKGMSPEYCLMDARTGKCLNKQPLIASENYLSDATEVEKSALVHLHLRFFADNTGEQTATRRILYNNLRVSVSEPLTAKSFVPKADLSFNEIDLGNNSSLSLEIPFSDDGLNFDVTSIKKLPRSCGDVKTIFYDRQVESGEGGSHIRYASKDGSSCDSFSYSDLSHNRGYLLLIEARNVRGLPLRVCVSNQSSRKCDIYEQLSEEKDFKIHAFLLSPTKDGGMGYDLNFNNYSVGRFESANDLRSVRVIPLPYEWLQSLKIKVPGKTPKTEKIKIQEVRNLGFGYYLSGTSKEASFLIMNQSFEKGWVLAEVMGDGREHLVFNGWANGWLVPPGEHKIVLIFIPQVLELLGLTLAVFVVYFLIKT